MLVSCSSDETSPTAPSAPTAVHAELKADTVNLTWLPVEGTGITYNIYKNDSPVKINTAPLTEAKFTDILKTTGSFTYMVTANVGGVESAKTAISEKIILELPKTKTVQITDKYYDTKYEYAYTYDTSNITKLATITTKMTDTNVKTQTSTITNAITKYTYTGDLITKGMFYSSDNVFKGSVDYVYNDQKKIIAGVRKNADGKITYTTTYTYNADGTITEKNDLPDSGPGIYTFEKGNLVKYNITTPLPDNDKYVSETNYVYDSKNDSHINVLGFNLFVSSNKNNAISSSSILKFNDVVESTESSKSDCTYNENNYILSSMKSLSSPINGVIQTEKIVVTYY